MPRLPDDARSGSAPGERLSTVASFVNRDSVTHPGARLSSTRLSDRKEPDGDQGQELKEEHGEEASPKNAEGEASGEEDKK